LYHKHLFLKLFFIFISCFILFSVPLINASVNNHISFHEPTLISNQINEVWNKTSGGPFTDTLRKCVLDTQMNVYAVGWSDNSSTNESAILIKYSPNGTLVWQREWANYSSNEQGWDIAYCNNSILIVTNIIEYGSYKGSSGVYMWDLNGNMIWQTHIYDYAFNSITASNKNIYIVGQNSIDGSLICLNYFGSIQWTKIFDTGNGNKEFFNSIDINKNYTMIAITGGIYLSGNPPPTLLNVRYYSNGTLAGFELWNESDSGGVAIRWDTNTTYVVTGSSSMEILSLRYNYTGKLYWFKKWNSPPSPSGVGIAINCSDIYICGGNGAAILLKYSNSGSLQWSTLWGDKKHDSQLFSGIVLDHNGGIYTVGDIWKSGQNASNILIVKFQEVTTNVPDFSITILPLILTIAIFIIITKRRQNDEIPC
jgi:hypothetical protein